MKEHLQPWYDRWLANNRETASLPQVHFVRDSLAGMFWRDVPYSERAQASPRESKETAFVIGEHISKSVRLPVYSLERPDPSAASPDVGIQIVLRYNYHDWNCSVVSETPVSANLNGFALDNTNNCFFQGFPAGLQFGPFSANPCKFSLCLHSDYEVYTFVWLLMRDRRRTP